jgi:hypothetical protein
MSLDDDDCRFTYSKQIGWGIYDTYSNRIARCEMYPIQCSLCIHETRLQPANHVGVWRNSEPDAVYHTGKPQIRSGQHVQIGVHSWLYVSQRAFAEIANHPPGSRVDQRKHLLANMRVGAL